jgi:PAS domain S-box-containing protein
MSTVLEDDKSQLWEKLSALSFTHPVVEHDHRVVRPDGRRTWMHWTHRALFNAKQELIEYQAVGCDITDRRQQEERSAVKVTTSQS